MTNIMPDFETLVTQAQTGNKEAMGRIIEYFDRIIRYYSKRLDNSIDEDCSQFIRCYFIEKIYQFRFRGA